MRTGVVLTGALTVVVLSAANVCRAGFDDDFNRPDGEMGNGWEIQTYGTIEVEIVDNELLIAGQQPDWWWRSGISRPVRDTTRFSFDFKADDNFSVHISLGDPETTDGVIEFYAWPGGPFSYGSRVSDVWTGWTKIPGSQMIAGEYNTLVVEQDGADFTLILNGQVVGTATNNIPFDTKRVFIGGDAKPLSAGSLHIDNVVIGEKHLCTVDFNGDSNVDGADVLTMADHWGTADSACDIAPIPWVDGVVDVEDLKVLAKYIGQPVEDPTLVAHWALDETEGVLAADSAGDSDAIVVGYPVWQPEGGMVAGALELDGVDDRILVSPLPSFADGPFSVLAWIKGGAPGRVGQVVLSQLQGASWLGTHPADGCLMANLCSSNGAGMPLFSDVVVTDGDWHRIGLVWDGMDRILYIDEQEVARDVQGELAITASGLILGAGPDSTRGSFWSGRIDDVRIYNRAVRP